MRQEDRKANLKYALFFLVVAIMLIVARQLGKDASSTSGQSTSILSVQFDLSVQRTSGEISPERNQSESSGYVVRFRLSNRGNHPVFCPVRPGTNILIGHIVYRTTANSEWMTFAQPAKSTDFHVPESNNQTPTWIEMPPGGWVDGQFHDFGWSGGDHAYVVDVKPERNAKLVSLVSPPYHLPAN